MWKNNMVHLATIHFLHLDLCTSLFHLWLLILPIVRLRISNSDRSWLMMIYKAQQIWPSTGYDFPVCINFSPYICQMRVTLRTFGLVVGRISQWFFCNFIRRVYAIVGSGYSLSIHYILITGSILSCICRRTTEQNSCVFLQGSMCLVSSLLMCVLLLFKWMCVFKGRLQRRSANLNLQLVSLQPTNHNTADKCGHACD